MQTPQRPSDGGKRSDGGPPSYEWLDEWLCEYVDGTMDPSVEAVFEKYVEANPELKAHVERLQQTRELLCGCELSEEPPIDAQAEVCREVEGDLLQTSAPLSTLASKHPFAALGLASSVAVALVVGFLAGSMLVDPATLSLTPRTSPVSTVEQHEPSEGPGPPRLEFSSPILHPERSVSTEEVALPHRSAGPSQQSPAGDTVSSASTLTAAEAR